MSIRSRVFGCASISLLLAAVACSAEDPQPASAPAEPTTAEDPSTIVTDVVVHLDAEGNATAVEVPITLGERRAQEAARAARGKGAPSAKVGEQSAAIVQASCVGDSFWAYDQTNLNGTRLCLSEPTWSGSAYLSSFCRSYGWSCNINGTCTKICTSTWDQNIRSYWSGYKAGVLDDGSAGSGGGTGGGTGGGIAGSGGASVSIPPYTAVGSIPFAPRRISLTCSGSGAGGAGGGATCPG